MNWYKKAKKQNFIIRKEIFKDFGPEVEMENAYALNGCYLGTPDEASKQIDEFDLDPNKIESNDCNNVCNIGFSPKKKKWYGWSHRAISGFGVGDEPCAATPTGNNTKHDGLAKDLDQAKEYAIEFAHSVASNNIKNKIAHII